MYAVAVLMQKADRLRDDVISAKKRLAEAEKSVGYLSERIAVDEASISELEQAIAEMQNAKAPL
jgi:hypothetical protein